MENTIFTPELLNRTVWLIAVVVLEYLLVLIATIGDLVSGLRKAKRNGNSTRSRALRRTVDKLARYYNVLAILTVVDAMQITGSFYMRIIEGYDIPTIPIFTLVGSLGMAIIEVKSIFENGNDKEKEDAKELADLITKLIGNYKLHELINILKSISK